MNLIKVSGGIVGVRISPEVSSQITGLIMHIKAAHDPGPAENAFIFLETNADIPQARYISWINLYDIEHAKKRQGGTWKVKEDPVPFDQEVYWKPYGWGGEALPSVADTKA
jgi:hypothetical protein